jgi:hypothetical protein
MEGEERKKRKEGWRMSRKEAEKQRMDERRE